MSNSRDWTRWGLTNPPRNGDQVYIWMCDVLWVVLASLEEINCNQRTCPAVRRVRALWTWGKITGGLVALGATVTGVIYWLTEIGR